MSYAETRTTDDRRRRRLAVTGDATSLDPSEGPGGIARLRDRLGELPAASPWLPRTLWKRGVLGAAFGLALAVAGFLLVQPLSWAPAIAPVADHLLSGRQPVLFGYLTTVLWLVAAQFAGLVGWYRSHSERDFRGRYRVWAGLVLAFAGASFLAGTGVHQPLAAAVTPHLPESIWRPATVTWLAPLAGIGAWLWWRMDRDLRRGLAGLWLTRLAGATLLATGLGFLFAPELAREAWYPAAMLLGPIIGLGLLVLGLWLQACYVAYVCADPPEPASNGWVRNGLALISSLLRPWWPFGRPAAEVEEPEAKPTRRRKKADDEEPEAAPKRRRKPAAKSRRTTKSRTRVKPEVEEEAVEDEEAAEESWEAEEESWDESAETPGVTDEAWLEAATAPEPVSTKPAPTPPRNASPPASTADDDDDGDDYRADGPHANADLFKGLSKRQRRELKRQLREQQRQRDD